MDAGVSRRLALAGVAAVAALGFSVSLLTVADPAASRAPGDELFPDLVVRSPAELYVTKQRKIRLRFSNTIANQGSGPLQIEGNGNLCDDGEGRVTLQTVFKDSGNPGSDGFFLRSQDPTSDQFGAGCSRYHPSHDHWHFDNFARYTLFRERTAALAAGSRKISFCVLDTARPFPGLPGSPSQRYYPQDNGEVSTCSATSVDGLSIGWEDTYGSTLRGQGINITKLRRGRYCLLLEVDPAPGVLEESHEANNAREVKIALRPKRGKVKRLGSNCRAV